MPLNESCVACLNEVSGHTHDLTHTCAGHYRFRTAAQVTAIRWLGDLPSIHRFLNSPRVSWAPGHAPNEPILYLANGAKVPYGHWLVNEAGNIAHLSDKLFHEIYERVERM